MKEGRLRIHWRGFEDVEAILDELDLLSSMELHSITVRITAGGAPSVILELAAQNVELELDDAEIVTQLPEGREPWRWWPTYGAGRDS